MFKIIQSMSQILLHHAAQEITFILIQSLNQLRIVKKMFYQQKKWF